MTIEILPMVVLALYIAVKLPGLLKDVFFSDGGGLSKALSSPKYFTRKGNTNAKKDR